MALADWSKISGADLRLIRKACHLNYGAISTGSESRYIHNGTENIFYVSQGMSTWFALVKPSSGTAKMKIGGIFKYYDNSNYVYSYLEIEVDSNGNIVSAKVVYGKVDGGQVVVELEDDVTDEIQHLAGMIAESNVVAVDDFEDGTTQGWEGNVEVVDEGYEGAKSLMVRAYCCGEQTIDRYGHKDVSGISWDIISVLCKRYEDTQNGSCPVIDIEGHDVPDNWGYIPITYVSETLDIHVRCYYWGNSPSDRADCRVYVDTVKYVKYINVAWAFIKFYGWLRQIGSKWYLDIEVRVSNNYYTNPDTSVEPPTTKISSYLMEIPSAIVGNNTKCGIILGIEASNWGNQDCPNIIIDYTKLFY